MMDAITALVAELRETEPPAERYDPRPAAHGRPLGWPDSPDDQR